MDESITEEDDLAEPMFDLAKKQLLNNENLETEDPATFAVVKAVLVGVKKRMIGDNLNRTAISRRPDLFQKAVDLVKSGQLKDYSSVVSWLTNEVKNDKVFNRTRISEEDDLEIDQTLDQALQLVKQFRKPSPKDAFVQGVGGRVDLSKEQYRKYNRGLIIMCRVPVFGEVEKVSQNKPMLVWFDSEIFKVLELRKVGNEGIIVLGRPLSNQTTALSVMGDLMSDNRKEKGLERLERLFGAV
jgi:hypothetical protein